MLHYSFATIESYSGSRKSNGLGDGFFYSTVVGPISRRDELSLNLYFTLGHRLRMLSAGDAAILWSMFGPEPVEGRAPSF